LAQRHADGNPPASRGDTSWFDLYPMLTVGTPIAIVITPPQLHIAVDASVSAGFPPTVVVG
jgi:hypothetical protein